MRKPPPKVGAYPRVRGEQVGVFTIEWTTPAYAGSTFTGSRTGQ